ncbi:MAG: pyridoxal-phosphate dependent enzyme [Planctomycetes bacterium]|jgi:1-aminocyclopropane-1-carboxylate deaminase/D-cysteine desulfhydrase-like pyridoxal-dependent ACC family enzyme|nr:pyridoxal-phosphate dependent enzyme [Planctomycetota bacterium]
MEALLARYPGLAAIPRVDLGVRPTPLEERTIAGLRILVKRDDLTSPLYGGNKVRALQFLLAGPARRVLTFSTLSAYHALATVLHGSALGKEVRVVLLRRGRRGPEVAALAAMGTRVIEARTRFGAVLAAARLWRPGTLIVPPGGLSMRGAVGYVAAAFEIGEVPPRIYLPLGTGTTASGLLAGLMIRAHATEVVAVRTVRTLFARPAVILRRARRVIRFLRRFDVTIPEVRETPVRLRVISAEGEYGEVTPSALAAVEAARPLALETTYSAKALAVLLADRAAGALFLVTAGTL